MKTIIYEHQYNQAPIRGIFHPKGIEVTFSEKMKKEKREKLEKDSSERFLNGIVTNQF